jgi:diacylglycerol kinase (ATP)
VNQPASKLLFIVNRHAGIGYAKQFEQLVKVACEANHADYVIEYTKARGHATELSSMAVRSGYNKVVAVGGDGTINEVAKGLLQSGIPMGIVPRGSGNGLARHLGIPLNTADAIKSVFSDRWIAMDIFQVNDKLSLNVSGIGFDGHITNLFGIKSPRGLVGYVTLVITEFFRFQEFETAITTDGKTFKRNAFIIAIANSSQYGNNAVIAPTASVCDGFLKVNIMKKMPLYRLDFVYAFFSGRLGNSSFCEIIETRSFAFKTKEPVSYHVDGEPCGMADFFKITLTPSALHVLLPKERDRVSV